MDWQSLHDFLSGLKTDMTGDVGAIVTGAKAIGGVGAVLYIASRIWRDVANNEPINFYPLFRPFVIAFVLSIYTVFTGGIDTLFQTVVDATGKLVVNNNATLEEFKTKKKNAEDQNAYDQHKGYLVNSHDYDAKLKELGISDPGASLSIVTETFAYEMKESVQEVIFEILNFFYQAASLIIDYVRTFFLIVLIMVGPISIGISVWDGFRDTIQFWAAKYIQVFLWSAVVNILMAMNSRVQVLMLKKAIDNLDSGAASLTDWFSASDLGYMIFLLMGIVGFTQVPSIAGMILHSCGVGGAMSKINAIGAGAGRLAGAGAGAAAGAAGSGAYSAAKNVGGAANESAKGWGSEMAKTGVYKNTAAALRSAASKFTPSGMGNAYGKYKNKS